MYRHLANLNRAGLVTASWDLPQAGPARKVYALTPRGEESLDRSVRGLETVMVHLGTLNHRCRAVRLPGADPGGPRRRRRS